jgi:hypothetical protein
MSKHVRLSYVVPADAISILSTKLSFAVCDLK